MGSSRIHGINIHKGLRSLGVKSYLLSTPRGYVEFLRANSFENILLRRIKLDFVIFQRVYGNDAIHLCRHLRKQGSKCGFFMADIYPNDMLSEVDFIVTPSELLRDYIVQEGYKDNKVFFLPDAIETKPILRKDYPSDFADIDQKVKIVWVGAEGHWNTKIRIDEILEHYGLLEYFNLISISNHPLADIKWKLDRVWYDILSCDIGIVPVDTSKRESLVKSNNRVSMFMALAMPVICSPLPSYLSLIQNEENGYIASGDGEWVKYLMTLRDVSMRKMIGEAAFRFIHSRYNIQAISNQFLSYLTRIADLK